MANQLSSQLLTQLFLQESNDPFLALVTLEHPDFVSPIRLVNNSNDIVSRGNTFRAFPMTIGFPVDDGESFKSFTLEFDNVSLELIDEVRSITTQMSVKIEMILASIPNDVQLSHEELKVSNVSYNKTKIIASIVLDNFLGAEITSEKYNPSNFPGIF